jgi:hypothetical protein
MNVRGYPSPAVYDQKAGWLRPAREHRALRAWARAGGDIDSVQRVLIVGNPDRWRSTGREHQENIVIIDPKLAAIGHDCRALTRAADRSPVI